MVMICHLLNFVADQLLLKEDIGPISSNKNITL